MKICPVGAELLPADSRTGKGQTDIEKLIVALGEFCERA